MPELPEVETVKRGLEPALLNTIIKTVTLNRPNLRIPFPDRLSERLEGKKCLNLRRRGKYIWVDLDSNETLVIHLGMSGSFTINPTNKNKHDHFILETTGGNTLVYNDPRRFGMIFLVPTGYENQHPAFAHMGPEPLGNDFHADYLIKAIKNKKTPIKTALLDQTIIAGIGNIYACEALYLSNISPLKISQTLSYEQADLLVQSIKSVLNAAINSGGSSLRDHKQTDGSMGYFQHSFKVYNREGQICPETGDKIVRISQSGRSTFYCPQKQR